MSKSISKSKNVSAFPCLYQMIIKFSCFDVLTGLDIKVDHIYINDEEITDYSIEEIENLDGTWSYKYTIETSGAKEVEFVLEKTKYYSFRSHFTLGANSIFDDPTFEDLGRLPLLSEIKTNAIFLSWGEFPVDLDAIVVNPDKSETYWNNRKTFYSIVDIDDQTSYGPETLSINKWIDFDSKYKIGGDFIYKVNWRRDGNVSMNKMDAKVKLFLNVNTPMDFIVDPSLDGSNRQRRGLVCI